MRTAGQFSSSEPSTPHTQERGGAGESQGRGLEELGAFALEGPCLGGAGRSSHPTWSDQPRLTAPRPGQDAQRPSLWPRVCLCVSGGVWECESPVPQSTAAAAAAAGWAVRGSAPSSPGGSWCRGGLKTRAWRPYQTTGFPEEGRVGVGRWDGTPPLGVPAWWRAHGRCPPGGWRTASPRETLAQGPAWPRTNRPQAGEARGQASSLGAPECALAESRSKW